MGLTYLTVEVCNPSGPDNTKSVECLIDSGAFHSVVPSSKLEGLRIAPVAEEEFRLADGSIISRKRGIAIFRYDGRVGGADVVFGEEGDSTLLGATTLEAMGLALNPIKRELHPIPMVL